MPVAGSDLELTVTCSGNSDGVILYVLYTHFPHALGCVVDEDVLVVVEAVRARAAVRLVAVDIYGYSLTKRCAIDSRFARRRDHLQVEVLQQRLGGDAVDVGRVVPGQSDPAHIDRN